MGLTELEQRLVKAATGGHELVCGGGEIRADVVRSLLLGHWADALDPHGIHVADARIIGTLDLDGMETTTQVRFIRCRFDEPVLASRAMLRRLELDGCELPSLRADGLTTELDLSIRDCTIAHDDADGPVRLRGTVIGGNLLCDGATLTNGSGPALNAKGLTTTGSVLLRHGFTATGAGEDGAVTLLGASIGRDLRCDGATLVNESGPALDADRVTVTGIVHLRDGFTATGTGQDGAVSLVSTRIGGTLDMRRARLRGLRTVALDLRWASAARFWLASEMLRQGGDAKRPDTWEPGGGIHLDGFVYTALDSRQPGASETLLEWIRHATPEYAPQPYRQLAAYHRSLGHETEARRTLMLQQEDALARGAIRGVLPRLGHWLFGVLLGYGYRTWRALASLVVVVVLACGIGLAAGHTTTGGTRAAAHPDGTACSAVERVGVGLDRGLPVIATGMSDRCELGSTTPAGQLYTAAGWVLQVAAWALATLVVAGYTGLIRKPE